MRALFLGLPLLWAFVACGDEGHQATPFTTYQACFDEHERDMLPVRENILECCLDHPIDGARPACGETTSECINYLTNNLDQTDAGTVEVMEACVEYIQQKMM
jgi:hypothetical protein